MINNKPALMGFCAIALTLSFFQSAYSYTLDEDVLEKCGQKHPNDIFGRVVCNNRMSKERCLKKEAIEISSKISKIEKIIERDNIEDATKLKEALSGLRDLRGRTLEIEFKENNQSKKSDAIGNGNPAVLIFRIQSECESDKYYLISAFENREKILYLIKVWQADRTTKTPTEELTYLRWSRSIPEISELQEKIEKRREAIRVRNACKKMALEKFNSTSAALSNEYSSTARLPYVSFMNSLNRHYADKASFNLIEAESKDNISVSIKAVPTCAEGNGVADAQYDLVRIPSQGRAKVEIDKVESKLVTISGKLDGFGWKSGELIAKEREAAQKERDETERKLAEEELRQKNLKEQDDRFFILMLTLIFGGYGIYHFLRKDNTSHRDTPDSGTGSGSSSGEESSESRRPDERSDSRGDHERILIDEFRARYPFIKIDVPLGLCDQFIAECIWLQKTTKSFPDKESQLAILKSLSS